MSHTHFRLLLLADTHIGLDFPVQPRVERRRRGYDFLANFRLALQPALNGDVDLVVHGGDLFDRSRVPDALVQIALEPLVEVAESGVPVFLVPGNHERAHIPLQLWRNHPNLHIFDHPGTFSVTKNDIILGLSGFPYTRKIASQFRETLQATGYQATPADMRLLCMHQVVEGAQVGPVDFTFRSGADVIRGAVIPAGFCAVLSGHIHRCQTLRHDLQGKRVAAPVIYPGSVERSAFAEQNEEKGYLILEISDGEKPGGLLEEIKFHRLPARPMVTLDFHLDGLNSEQMLVRLKSSLAALDVDAVVRIRLQGEVSETAWQVFNAANLRSLAPATMNITVSGAWRESE